MNNRLIFLGIFMLSLLIPGLYLLNLESLFHDGSTQDEILNGVGGYRLRVWLSWLIMVLIAIYYKWTSESNLFFKLIYFLMVLALGVEGIYMQRYIARFDIGSNFQDPYTYGILMTVINIFLAVIITAFVHIGVWWFTRKWHRN